MAHLYPLRWYLWASPAELRTAPRRLVGTIDLPSRVLTWPFSSL